MRSRALPVIVVLLLVMSGCSSTGDPGKSAGSSSSLSLTAPLAAADPEAFRKAEAGLRRDGRNQAGLVGLGSGALDLAELMDGAASFLLTQLPARLSAAAPGASGGRLAAPRLGLPPPGAQVFGTYLMTTVAFDSLIGAGESGKRTGGENPPTCPCTDTVTVPLTTDEVSVGGNTGVITTTMTATATVSGSSLSIDLSVKVNGEVRDSVTGAVLYKIANEATGHADGNACPDASGTATANMLFGGQESYFDANGAKVGSRVSESFGGELRIRVDDNAKIAGVDIKPTGQGGELMMRIAAQSSAPAFEKAWRSGLCIALIVSPEGGEVDKDSETTVTAKVKHKIEGNELEKPVEATFDGVKSIDPTTKQKAPAAFRYTAGPADGDKGNLSFESVSNRGIGRTAVTFTVAGGWRISSVGNLTETVAVAGSVHSARVSFTDVKVSAGKDSVLTGSGPITLKGSFEAHLGEVDCSAPIDRTFTFSVTGTLVGTGPAAVLRLKISAPTPPGETLQLTCDGFTIPMPMPGEGNFYGFALGELELPAAGGTRSFDRSVVVGGLANVRSTATVTVVRNTR